MLYAVNGILEEKKRKRLNFPNNIALSISMVCTKKFKKKSDVLAKPVTTDSSVNAPTDLSHVKVHHEKSYLKVG